MHSAMLHPSHDEVSGHNDRRMVSYRQEQPYGQEERGDRAGQGDVENDQHLPMRAKSGRSRT
jgi:hypothetical protein